MFACKTAGRAEIRRHKFPGHHRFDAGITRRVGNLRRNIGQGHDAGMPRIARAGGFEEIIAGTEDADDDNQFDPHNASVGLAWRRESYALPTIYNTRSSAEDFKLLINRSTAEVDTINVEIISSQKYRCCFADQIL